MCLKSEAHRIGFQDPIPPRSARAPRWRPKAEANQPASVSSRKMTNNVTNTSSAEDRGPAISIKEERGFCKRWAGHRQDELYQAEAAMYRNACRHNRNRTAIRRVRARLGGAKIQRMTAQTPAPIQYLFQSLVIGTGRSETRGRADSENVNRDREIGFAWPRRRCVARCDTRPCLRGRMIRRRKNDGTAVERRSQFERASFRRTAWTEFRTILSMRARGGKDER